MYRTNANDPKRRLKLENFYFVVETWHIDSNKRMQVENENVFFSVQKQDSSSFVIKQMTKQPNEFHADSRWL